MRLRATTVLARVAEDGHRGVLDRSFPIAVGEHHARRLAAQLERDAGDVVRRRPQDRGAGRGLPGERDLVHPGIADQRVADHTAGTRQHRDAALRHARLDQQLAEHERGDGGQRSGLDDHRVAARERRGGLPARDQQREVPRDDERTDADRLAQHDVEARVRHGDDLAEVLVRRTREVLEGPCRGLDLPTGVADRLPRVARLCDREELRALPQQARDAQQHAASIGRGRGRPHARLECRERGADCGIDVRDARPRDLRQLCAGTRFANAEVGTFECASSLTADEQVLNHGVTVVP